MIIYCTILATLTVVSMLMCLCLDAGKDFVAVGHVGIVGVVLCFCAWLLFAAYHAGMNNLLCW